METVHREALRRCRVRIVRDMMVNSMWDALVDKEIFSDVMIEYIQAERTETDQKRKLLTDLTKRGPQAFAKFVVVLRETRHPNLAELLLKTEQEEMLKAGGVPASVPIGIQESSYGQSGMMMASSGHTVMQPTDGSAEMNDQEMTDVNELASGNPTEGQKTTPGQALASNYNQGTHDTGGQGAISMDEMTYKMNSTPRGYMLIIDNKNFKADLNDRIGTDTDCEKLDEMFKNFGFRVHVEKNATAQIMLQKMQEFSQLTCHNTTDSCIVAILTHGADENYVFGVDGGKVNIDDLLATFRGGRCCPGLIGKPKFFIIQACRGETLDQANNVTDAVVGDASDQSDVVAEPLSNQDYGVEMMQRAQRRLPKDADMLIAYSTVPGHVSWRNQEKGSWFIQALVNVFTRFAATTDVTNMLVQVNRKVANEFEADNSRQIPAPVVMLTKTWFLNPEGR